MSHTKYLHLIQCISIKCRAKFSRFHTFVLKLNKKVIDGGLWLSERRKVKFWKWKKVGLLQISCWCNRGVQAVQKKRFPFWHHWSESVWSQPTASSFLISQQCWAAVGKTSAAREAAHRSAIAHMASVTIVVFLGCASALQRSEWLMCLMLKC